MIWRIRRRGRGRKKFEEFGSPSYGAAPDKQVTGPYGLRSECETAPSLRDEANEEVERAKSVSSSFLLLFPGKHTCCEQCQTGECGYPSGGRGWRRRVYRQRGALGVSVHAEVVLMS